MPTSVPELLELLQLEEIESGLYRGQNPVTRRQRAFGGQVLAQALMAAYRTVPDDRLAHSLHAYFLRSGRTDRPMIYDVEAMRDGRSFSSRRVLARQDGQVIFALTASLQVHEDGLTHHDPAPTVPPPEDCPRMSQVMAERYGAPAEFWEAEWGVLDVRFITSGTPGDGEADAAHSASARVWVRVNGDLPEDPGLHQAALAYASDLTLLSASTVPHQVQLDGANMQSASLDHAMWFHRPIRADRWWLHDEISPSASNARGFALGRIFSEGRLGATTAQEGLVRVRGELEERR
ncbi:acyl-CoA thioesterase II [Enemella dayhoffiae]|uniref:Acyl-CoA thioesterase 2 n=1 Tax=Enemella dayhoffiae TaxID=2016507 RepID=A0A255H2X5_9ACTN|nr:acyl-CoA thioesterase II [Enemella dayhoffiae]OYO22025.1 acyl-CoA thioesterase II [Enemella dayhoffiae]